MQSLALLNKSGPLPAKLASRSCDISATAAPKMPMAFISPFRDTAQGANNFSRVTHMVGGNESMASWLVVLGFWGCSALICLPVLMGGAAALTAFAFLFLLLALSTYLYSASFAALVDWLMGRHRAT
jgi:hypothetical protein